MSQLGHWQCPSYSCYPLSSSSACHAEEHMLLQKTTCWCSSSSSMHTLRMTASTKPNSLLATLSQRLDHMQHSYEPDCNTLCSLFPVSLAAGPFRTWRSAQKHAMPPQQVPLHCSLLDSSTVAVYCATGGAAPPPAAAGLRDSQVTGVPPCWSPNQEDS